MRPKWLSENDKDALGWVAGALRYWKEVRVHAKYRTSIPVSQCPIESHSPHSQKERIR
jgi:hypothetical protein